MEADLLTRADRVYVTAKQILQRIGKEEYVDEDEEWPFELALGAKVLRAVVATVQEGADLNDEIVAYLALGAAITEIHYFAKLQVPFEIPDVAIIRVMKRLGYEAVLDRCELYFVDMLSKAKLEDINGILDSLNTIYIVFATPDGKIFAFKKSLKDPAK